MQRLHTDPWSLDPVATAANNRLGLLLGLGVLTIFGLILGTGIFILSVG